MGKRDEIVGAVDFGSREIRVLIGRKDAEGVQVLGHGVASGRGCISQGVIQNLGAAQDALKQALSAAEKEARYKVGSLFCGVNGRNVETFIREGNVRVEPAAVAREHMTEARDIASRDILAAGKRLLSSIAAQEWYVDDMRVIDPIGIRGQVLKNRVHFARLPAVIEDNIIACIDSQGRELEDLVFQPLAAALGCLTPEDMELGVAVLDIGRATTGLAVFRDYRILGTHCFEWGGYHLTRDVAAGLQISFDEADELILEYGISDVFIHDPVAVPIEIDDPAALPPRPERTRIKLKSAVHGAPNIVERDDLDTIVYERAHELINRVRQHLHQRDLSKNLVRGVVVTGGGSTLRNLAPLSETVFQVPCRVGLPTGVDVLPRAVQSPAFTAAVGILRHGFHYRAAARNGHVDPRGPLFSGYRRLVHFLRKYFF